MSGSEPRLSPPSPEPSAKGPTLYAGVISRHFRRDNAHVWLPLSSVLLYAALEFGPLVVRRVPRFASSGFARDAGTFRSALRSTLVGGSSAWISLYTLARNNQFERACEADQNLGTLQRARWHMAFPNNSTLHLLFSGQGAQNPIEKPEVPAKHAEANGVLDVAALYLSRLIVPSTSEKILRGLIEEDMRQRNICQYDIDATVCFLAGAMESEKYLFTTIVSLAAIPAVFVLDHLEKLGPWKSALPMLFVPAFAISLQGRWLPMHIHDKSAVAAFLKERLSIS